MRDFIPFQYDRDFRGILAGTKFIEFPSGQAVTLRDLGVGHILDETVEKQGVDTTPENKMITPVFIKPRKKRRRAFGL